MASKPKANPALDAAIQREIQRQRGQEVAARAIAELEARMLQERAIVQTLASALAAMEGQQVTITNIEPSPETGLIVAVHYVTADGQSFVLPVNHTDPPPAARGTGLVLPN